MNLLKFLTDNTRAGMANDLFLLTRAWVTVVDGDIHRPMAGLLAPVVQYKTRDKWVLGASQAVKVFGTDSPLEAPLAKLTLHHEAVVVDGGSLWTSVPDDELAVIEEIAVTALRASVGSGSRPWEAYRPLSWPLGAYETAMSDHGPVLSGSRDGGYRTAPFALADWLRKNQDRSLVEGQSRPNFCWALRDDANGYLKAASPDGEEMRLTPLEEGVVSMAPVDSWLGEDGCSPIDIDVAALSLREGLRDKDIYFVRADARYVSEGRELIGDYEGGTGALDAADDMYASRLDRLRGEYETQIVEHLATGPLGEDGRTSMAKALL